jgi:hypothetical protein
LNTLLLEEKSQFVCFCVDYTRNWEYELLFASSSEISVNQRKRDYFLSYHVSLLLQIQRSRKRSRKLKENLCVQFSSFCKSSGFNACDLKIGCAGTLTSRTKFEGQRWPM